MLAECCVCGCDIILPDEAFLDVEQDPEEEYLCDHCTEEAKKFAK